MAYCNRKTYPLRYTDFDFKDELSLSSILGLAQESACLSADELGFGYHDLKPLSYGFLVVHNYCELFRPIGLTDSLTVETWPLPPRHFIFERHYRLLCGEELVGAIASRWCLVDLKTFSLLPPEKLGEANANCPYRAEKAVVCPGWKIPPLTQAAREIYRMKVGSAFCDHYFHANNTRYAEFFVNCFTMEELASRPIRSFHITYAKQAKEGRELSFWREDRGNISLCEARDGQEVLTQFRIVFAEEGV